MKYIQMIQRIRFPSVTHAHTHKHTCTPSHWCNSHSPAKPGLAGYLLNFLLPLVPNFCVLSWQTKTSNTIIPACLPWASHLSRGLSTSIIVMCLIWWVSSLCSACPNHLWLPLLITRLTGSSPSSFELCIFLSFLSEQTHISVWLCSHLYLVLNFRRPCLRPDHSSHSTL